MAAIRRRDTEPEVALRSALHRLGYRFRKDHPVRIGRRLIRPDIVFTKRKVAIFVDGCFWHGCPIHGRQPKENCDYWLPKLEENSRRDRAQTAALEDAGWRVLRFWEHEDAQKAVGLVQRVVTLPPTGR
jgi:DNA mismatch endonuclease (patch repair protein)